MSGLTGFLVMPCLSKYSDGAVNFTGPTGVAAPAGDNAVTVSVVETSMDTATRFTVTATTDHANKTVAFAFATDGNRDAIAISTITGEVVKLAASKTLDKATKSSYTLKITGVDSAPTTATLTVTLTVTNKLEFAKTSYAVCVAEGTIAGNVIGTYTPADAAATDTVAYTNAPNTDLTVDTLTGALKVATGKTLTSATTGGYTTTITATATGTGVSAPS